MSPPTIVIVDDDPAMLSLVATVLREFCEVFAFSDARLALAALAKQAPDAIVSDVVMPHMGGFEFRRQYAQRFGDRKTPFLFLSSLGDAETMVAGLEAGADDFLVKPVVPELLRARVRALLRRRPARPAPEFQGDFAKLPFPALLEFCETKRFTGQILVDAGELRLALPVHGGELDAEAAAPWLDRLCELTSGRFELRVAKVEFDEIAVASAQRTAPEPAQPVARLSSIVVKGKRLQIETELVEGEAPVVVSVVLAGTEPVAKFRRTLPADADGAARQAAIDAQHAEAEAAMHDRISALRHRWQHGAPQDPAGDGPESAERAAGAAEPRAEEPAPGTSRTAAAAPTKTVAALFDEGFDHSRRGDWRRALTCWEEALAREPDNRTLRINVEVARKKLEA